MLAALWLGAGSASVSFATPALVIEYPSGAVLYEDHATQPWYPASLTKLMTVYVALKAVREKRLALDTPLVVSARAAAMPPSKMGFRPGTMVTLGNALKMIMVKSANDIAITIAEGVSGSVDAFADEMNEAAASLSLDQSHFVNPNGLPNPQHVSSARDLAILASALYSTYPEQADLFGIGALQLGDQIITNHNNLLGRYPGADGMKTGFICASGFNVVASATQGGRKLIAVILGAPTVALRTIKAAALFDRGFAGVDRPSGPVAALPAQPNATAPDLTQSICRKRAKAMAEFSAENERLIAPLEAGHTSAPGDRPLAYKAAALARTEPMARRIAMVPAPSFDPKPIFVGAPDGYAGPIAQARPPHAPLGAAPPPDAVSAYAPASPAASAAPLAPDAAALPMKLRGEDAALSSGRAHGRKHRQNAAETGSVGDKQPAAAPKTAKPAKGEPAKTVKALEKSKASVRNKTAAKTQAAKRKAKSAETAKAQSSNAKSLNIKTANSKSTNAHIANAKTSNNKTSNSKTSNAKTASDKGHPAKPAAKLAQKQAGETKTAARANKAKPGHADAAAGQ